VELHHKDFLVEQNLGLFSLVRVVEEWVLLELIHLAQQTQVVLGDLALPTLQVARALLILEVEEAVQIVELQQELVELEVEEQGQQGLW
jgi:hypothetical protein